MNLLHSRNPRTPVSRRSVAFPERAPLYGPPHGPLRIALTAPPWYNVPPMTYGGIEAMVADLADELVARGHDVVLVGSGVNGTRARFLRTFAEAPSARIGEAMPELMQAAWISRHLDDVEVDIVHDHSLAGPLAARGRAVPTVMTTHSPCSGEMVTYYRHLSPDVRFVAVSEAQRRLAPDLNWVGRVHNAIKVADFPFRESKDDYVLFIGRFNPTKGAHLAIDAARRAGRPILLAGKVQEPVELDYFDAEIRPRLGSDAEFLGEVGMRGKQELYAAAHCVLFPISWDEPFGMVMIEAMACGTPVVAFRRGAVPEVVLDGVTGFVLDDHADLPAAIGRAGEIVPGECRRHVARCFDVSTMATGYEQVYRRLTGAGLGTPADDALNITRSRR